MGDLSGSGRPQIYVSDDAALERSNGEKDQPGRVFPSDRERPDGGYFSVLEWNGQRYEEIYKSSRCGNKIFDLAIGDPLNDGGNYLVVAAWSKENGKDKSYLYIFEPSEALAPGALSSKAKLGGCCGTPRRPGTKPLSEEPRPARTSGRGRLGVWVAKVPPEIAKVYGVEAGVFVTDVMRDSPAAKAGVESQDIILKVDGQTVEDQQYLVRMIEQIKPGTRVRIELIRQGKPLTVMATVAPAE